MLAPPNPHIDHQVPNTHMMPTCETIEKQQVQKIPSDIEARLEWAINKAKASSSKEEDFSSAEAEFFEHNKKCFSIFGWNPIKSPNADSDSQKILDDVYIRKLNKKIAGIRSRCAG